MDAQFGICVGAWSDSSCKLCVGAGLDSSCKVVFRTSTNFSPIGAVNAFSALGLFRVTMATAPLRSTVTNSSVFRVAAVIER